ncbi:XdhC/CoxI family protein [soil metagenome]
MSENQSILAAFQELSATGAAAALANVVRVTGSSYRRPGARMLVASDGRTWGGVSGGCLERDVARRARTVIETGLPAFCSFDTTEELDDPGAARGAALGCAGMIDIFIQRLSAAACGPMPWIQRAHEQRIAIAVATVVRSDGGNAIPGTCFTQDNAPPSVREQLALLAPGKPTAFVQSDGAEFFVELIRPPQSLVVLGGGTDVVPVVTLSKTLGWHVTVIASHASIGYQERFRAADVVTCGTDDAPFGGLTIQADSAVVMMTHNYVRDLAVLGRLMDQSLKYLGILGPRRRAERLVAESGKRASGAMEKIYAPVGLDIGGNTPETIALAIVAEIQAVLAGHDARSLRDRTGPIYEHASTESHKMYNPTTCPISA